MKLGSKSPLRRDLPLRVRAVTLRGGSCEREVMIARLALRGHPPRLLVAGRELIEDGLGRWPAGVTAKFLLLPGGFASASWPRSWSGRWGWDSDVNDFEILKRHIEPCIATLISARVRRAALGKVDVIVFGIDVCSDPKTGPLAELAVVYHLANSVWHITGKSFPRGDQHRVIRVKDLRSHFVESSGERVLVLGCHDLNIFSPRDGVGSGRTAIFPRCGEKWIVRSNVLRRRLLFSCRTAPTRRAHGFRHGARSQRQRACARGLLVSPTIEPEAASGARPSTRCAREPTVELSAWTC